MQMDGDHRFVFEHDGIRHDVYRDGSGPGVLLMHELPGMSQQCIDVADRLMARGFSPYLPLFFGHPRQNNKLAGAAGTAWLCVRGEMNALSSNAPSKIAVWLRTLCRRMLSECGGKGVGVIGMCLTGHLVISVMLDESVLVPVMCEPSVPLRAKTTERKAAVGVPAEDLARAAQRQLPVLGFRFATDTECPPQRFETLQGAFGACFRGESIPTGPNHPGNIPKEAHSVLTKYYVDEPDHPTRKAFDKIVERLETLRRRVTC